MQLTWYWYITVFLLYKWLKDIFLVAATNTSNPTVNNKEVKL